MQQELILSSLAATLLVLSCAVWYRLAVRWRTGKPPLTFRKRVTVEFPPATVFLVICWTALQLTGQFQQHNAVPNIQLVQTSCVTNALLLVLLLGLLSLRGTGLRDYGFRYDDLGPQAWCGVCGLLASLLPVYLVLALTFPWRTSETQHALLRLLESNMSFHTLVWIGIAVVVLAPLVEELIFRVILQTWLLRYLSWPWAILLTAVLFSAVHGFPDSLPLFPLAIVLGYVFHREHSYWAVVVLHALFNTLNLGIALLSN